VPWAQNHFARNFWLVAGRRGFACRELALLNVLAMIKAQLPQSLLGRASIEPEWRRRHDLRRQRDRAVGR
jgi:hypothetical protein